MRIANFVFGVAVGILIGLIIDRPIIPESHEVAMETAIKIRSEERFQELINGQVIPDDVHESLAGEACDRFTAIQTKENIVLQFEAIPHGDIRTIGQLRALADQPTELFVCVLEPVIVK